jgi:hypothetical protein
MRYFHTKPSKLDIFWKALEWKNLISFWPFGVLWSHLLRFMLTWYILWSFAMLSQYWHVEISGNPGVDVMITVFSDFTNFRRTIWRISQKPML